MLKPFTSDEQKNLLKLLRFFAQTHSNRETKNWEDIDIPFSSFGLNHDEKDMNPEYLKVLMGKAPYEEIVTQTHKTQLIPVEKLVTQDQNGVGLKNLQKVLSHWDTAPLPELVALPNGMYWVMEGHHRICLQILAGRHEIEATVTYDPHFEKFKNAATFTEALEAHTNVLMEGVIAVPPLAMVLAYHWVVTQILWHARDQWRDLTPMFQTKENAALWQEFQDVCKKHGVRIPKEDYPEKFDLKTFTFDITDLPLSYQKLAPVRKGYFFIGMQWKPENETTMAAYYPDMNSIVIQPTNGALKNYPNGAKLGELEIALDRIKKTLHHEMQHMIQYNVLRHPDQKKKHPTDGSVAEPYLTSPVEFDPQIISAIADFYDLLEMIKKYSVYLPAPPTLRDAINVFVGLTEAEKGHVGFTSSFFSALKDNAPKRWKLAIKKFVSELEKELVRHPVNYSALLQKRKY
jgi:hypothetical protein